MSIWQRRNDDPHAPAPATAVISVSEVPAFAGAGGCDSITEVRHAMQELDAMVQRGVIDSIWLVSFCLFLCNRVRFVAVE